VHPHGQEPRPPAIERLAIAAEEGIGRLRDLLQPILERARPVVQDALRRAPPRLRALWARRSVRVATVVVAAIALFAGVALARFGVRLGELRDRHATGPSWAFPSRVYTDGLAFAPGRTLPRAYLARHLDARFYHAAARPLTRPGTYSWRDDGIEIFLRGFTDAVDPEGYGGPERVRVVIEDDRVAGVARLTAPPGAIPGDLPPPDLGKPPRLEPWRIAMLAEPNGARRTWVPLSRIPPVVQDAVIAAEDRRFRSHFGLDLKGSLRAFLVNTRAGEVREGASTLTMQLARGLFLGRERTFARKFREMGYALLLEVFLSKDQILEMYLNSIYWGQGDTRAVAGIEEAARWYFSTGADSLGLNEAATLAGIIPAPVAYSPFRHPERARARRNAVLADMAQTGAIDARTAARERAKKLRLDRGTTRADRYPDVMSAADVFLDRRLPEGAQRRWGLEILTTIDLVWQQDAEREVRRTLAELDPAGTRGGRRSPLQGAFVAIDPGSGEIRAIVGGRVQTPGDYNRAIQARRQTGSSIKPLVYAAALDPSRGEPRFTMRSHLADMPRTFRARGVVWTPQNANGSYHSALSLPDALGLSANVATANLVEAIGPDVVARYGERFGLGELKPVLSIGLGSNEVTLVDLVAAYAVIDFGGLRHEPTPVRAAVDARGKDLLPPAPAPTRVIPPAVATLTRMLLEHVVEHGISGPLRWAYGFMRPVGGKTGTTNENKDAWYCGITPELAAGVWCGYDRPRNLGRTAAGVAMPVWARVMNRMLDGWPEVPFSDDPGVIRVFVDGRTDSLARRDCPWKVVVPLVLDALPDTCRSNHREDWDRILLARIEADSLAAIHDSLAGRTLRPPTDARISRGGPPFMPKRDSTGTTR
jgi:penicillin-binding protein 1B